MRRTRPSLLLLALLCAAGCSLITDDPWDTDIAESEAFDAAVGTWSPDGTQIAFQHSTGEGSPDPGTYDQLWIASLETGARHMVHTGRILNVDWSPDGQWFVFHSFTDPEFLFKVDVQGQHLTRLTGKGSPNAQLRYTGVGRWSPNGDRILFMVGAGEPRGIAIMKPDGSEARILIPYGITGAWFPDGEHLAYANWDMTQPVGRQLQLYTATREGTEIRKLTDLPDSDLLSQPAVSPDGKQIAFAHRGRDRSSEIFLMSADGTNLRQVTEGEGIAERPAWHPEGKKILFGRFVPNHSRRLYLLDVQTLEVAPVFPKK